MESADHLDKLDDITIAKYVCYSDPNIYTKTVCIPFICTKLEEFPLLQFDTEQASTNKILLVPESFLQDPFREVNGAGTRRVAPVLVMCKPMEGPMEENGFQHYSAVVYPPTEDEISRFGLSQHYILFRPDKPIPEHSGGRPSIQGWSLKTHLPKRQVLVAGDQTGLEIDQDEHPNYLKILYQAFIQEPTDSWEYATYTPFGSSNFPKIVKGLPKRQKFANKLYKIATRRLKISHNRFLKDWPAFNISPSLPEIEQDLLGTSYSKAVLASVNYAPISESLNLTQYVIQHWSDDIEFCQQLLQGVNPLHIALYKSIDEATMPIEIQQLKIKEYDDTMTGAKDLVKKNRMFVLNYKVLENFSRLREDRQFLPCTMFVYKEMLEDGSSRLNVFGIVLYHLDPSTGEYDKTSVYYPSMDQPNKYRLAKMFVASADTHIHEFLYHLGFAHMAMEPFIVATYKAFKSNHILKRLLTPHFEDTIAINWLARHDMSFTDVIAIGHYQGLKLIDQEMHNWHFEEWNFENQLKSRGFGPGSTDGLENYFYRDDGFLLWNAIGEYTKAVVTQTYNSDPHLQGDTELIEWIDQLSSLDKGSVKGFPNSIKTREKLSKILQTIIWNGSGLHSAINYSQFPYDSMIPNRPASLKMDMPLDDGRDITPEDLKNALPSAEDTWSQMQTVWRLTLPPTSTFMTLNAFPMDKPEYQEISERFSNKMRAINDALNTRNSELIKQGKAPYSFLLPANVACSVNI